jgi:hypothetical protein
VVIGDPIDDQCPGSSIGGSVTLTNNSAGAEVSHNPHIGGTVLLISNAGAASGEDAVPEVEANTITGQLICNNNRPAVTNDGQPNTAAGTGGQCGGL